MCRSWTAAIAAAAHIHLGGGTAMASALGLHDDVRGAEVTTGDLRATGAAWRSIAWDNLSETRLDPGAYELRFRADGGSDGGAVSVPSCAGRGSLTIDGQERRPSSPAPVIVPIGPGFHDVVVELTVSGFERRIACGERPRAGPIVQTLAGLGVLTFSSPHATRGGGRAVIYVPHRHNVHEPRPLLVGLHPWNGSMWTYASYAQLLTEAERRDVCVLLPSGLGNSLYAADAEDEVMRAIDAFSDAIPVDGRAITIWGASMGGAGATTIGFHRPDRFAGVVSFFGDSKYDLATYVRFVLPNEEAARAVNALDVVDNARSLPVWLIHGADDRTSPIRQSTILAAAMVTRGFPIRFDRVAGAGHEGALVARFLPQVVASAASTRIADVRRVTYRSTRPIDRGAYQVHFERASPNGEAFVDIERSDDGVHVLRAEGVRSLVLTRGALGTSADQPPPIVVPPGSRVTARWGPPQ